MKTAILFGASGNVGSHLLQLLLASDKYHQVKIVVRKPLPIRHPKLISLIADYTSLSGIKEQLGADDVFIILGISDKKVERNYPVLIAQLCKAQGAATISIVTAVGADPASKLSFTRIKGEIEQDILNLNYSQTHLYRPGMILGERTFYRPMERVMMRVWKFINPFLVGKLSRFKGMEARHMALAMYLNVINNTVAVSISYWKEMNGILKANAKNEPAS